MMFPRILSLIALFTTLASAHTILTYPGWRENNLITNDTFPFGMQWMYPCGGTKLSSNRTLWPVTGGAVAIQPGWFQGHATAFFYINMGFGGGSPFDNGPPNMSFPMVPVFQITGPSKGPYPGSFCLPQIPLPVNTTVKIGDNATIQIVEVAVHGASLYNCVDITFADPKDVPEVNGSNCINSTDIGFNNVFTTDSSATSSALLSKAVSTGSTMALLAGLSFALYAAL